MKWNRFIVISLINAVFFLELVYRMIASACKQNYKKMPYQNIETSLWQAVIERKFHLQC